MGFNTNILLVGAVVGIMFLSLGSAWFTIADYYGTEVPEEYEELFDSTSATYDIYRDQQNIMDGGDINTEGQDQAVYSNVIVATKQSQDAYRLSTAVITSSGKTLGIDPSIIAGIFTIIGILSVAAFMATITGNKNN